MFRKQKFGVRFPALARFSVNKQMDKKQISFGLRDTLLHTPYFVQLFYAARELWMGISPLYNFHFAIDKFQTRNAWVLIFLALLGIIGAFSKQFWANSLFSFLNLLLFSYITLTYIKTDPQSGGGVNYAIETLGAIWLVYQVHYRRKRRLEFKQFITDAPKEDLEV